MASKQPGQPEHFQGFTYSAWMNEKSPEPTGQPPRMPRASVFLTATLKPIGAGEATKHRVRDLSRGGVRIDSAGELRPGARVIVCLGAINGVPAEVVWIRGNLAGLSFKTEIDPDMARGKGLVPSEQATPPRPTGTSLGPPNAGWAADLKDAYRR